LIVINIASNCNDSSSSTHSQNCWLSANSYGESRIENMIGVEEHSACGLSSL